MSNLRPPIICICGSNRFTVELREARRTLTLLGNIVIGAEVDLSEDYFSRDFKQRELDEMKEELDRLHLRKIDLADEVYIVNVGGYMGESTRNELAYAQAHGKTIRYFQPEFATDEEGQS